jgi:anti-anti-sigma factor
MKPQAVDESRLADLPRGGHVCWAIRKNARYEKVARRLIDQGKSAGEKVVVFAPSGSSDSAGGDVVAVDPLDAFLAGTFDAQTMFAVFREQDRIARAEGFSGLCIVADMDWLRRADPSVRQVMEYELLGDRLVRELGATAVCTYRSSSYRPDIVLGAQAVHRFACGEPLPPFQLVAGDGDGWVLLGEVDVAVEPQFGIAVDVAVGAGPCVIDISGLEFIDVAGMRTLANACAQAETAVRLEGASPSLQRFWKLGAFEDVVPIS